MTWFYDEPLDFSQDRIRSLEALLVAAYPSQADLVYLAENIGIKEVELTRPATGLTMIREIIKKAEFASLRKKLIAEVTGDLSRAGFHDRLRELMDDAGQAGLSPSGLAANQAINPYDSSVLNGSSVMLNRSTLRTAVQDLIRPYGNRILVVKDKDQPTTPGIYRTKTGKSHTVHYIAYLRVAKREFQSINIDLEELAERVPEESEGWIQPSDLAKVLLKKLGMPLTLLPVPPNNSQWPNWVGDFVDNLEAELRQSDQNWWVVIDGFNTVILPEQTFILVRRIARMVSMSLDNIRLVLLGYGSTLSPDNTFYVAVENPVRTLQRDEVFRELAKVYAQACHQRQIPYTPESISRLVARTMGAGDQQEYSYADLVSPVLACLTTLQGVTS